MIEETRLKQGVMAMHMGQSAVQVDLKDD